MVVTTRVRLDRISSATRNAALSPEVIVGDEIVPAEGYVLAVRILEDKSTYNTVEDVTGRMLSLRAGDVLAGVLGTRRALRGYAGVVPSHLAAGDTIEVLNLGGILGRCTSVNPEIGAPFKAEVLGAILAFPELGDRVAHGDVGRHHAGVAAERAAGAEGAREGVAGPEREHAAGGVLDGVVRRLVIENAHREHVAFGGQDLVPHDDLGRQRGVPGRAADPVEPDTAGDDHFALTPGSV